MYIEELIRPPVLIVKKEIRMEEVYMRKHPLSKPSVLKPFSERRRFDVNVSECINRTEGKIASYLKTLENLDIKRAFSNSAYSFYQYHNFHIGIPDEHYLLPSEKELKQEDLNRLVGKRITYTHLLILEASTE